MQSTLEEKPLKNPGVYFNSTMVNSMIQSNLYCSEEVVNLPHHGNLNCYYYM